MSQTAKSIAPETANHPIRPKLDVAGAANFLGVSESMINKLRITSGGPEFLKIGRRVLYDVADLEAWAASRKRRHTSECSPTRT